MFTAPVSVDARDVSVTDDAHASSSALASKGTLV